MPMVQLLHFFSFEIMENRPATFFSVLELQVCIIEIVMGAFRFANSKLVLLGQQTRASFFAQNTQLASSTTVSFLLLDGLFQVISSFCEF